MLDPTEDDEGVVEALDCAVDLLSADLAQAILARLCIAPVGDEQVLLRAVELPRQK